MVVIAIVAVAQALIVVGMFITGSQLLLRGIEPDLLFWSVPLIALGAVAWLLLLLI